MNFASKLNIVIQIICSQVLFMESNLYNIEGPSWSWSYGSWFKATCAISAYHHWSCRNPLRQGLLDITLCDKVVSDLRQVGGFLWALWFSSPIKLTATIYLKYCWKNRLKMEALLFIYHFLLKVQKEKKMLTKQDRRAQHLMKKVTKEVQMLKKNSPNSSALSFR